VVELGEVGQDGETVRGATARHVDWVEKGGDSKLLFSQSENELAVAFNIRRVKAVKGDEIWTKPVDYGTKSESILPGC